MSAVTNDWGALVLETLRSPADAAKRILGWELPRGVLMQALFAVAALNALIGGVGNVLMPSPLEIPGVLASPLAFFLLIAVGVLFSAYLFHWVGRAMGGSGSIDDVLVLLIWLQALRTLAQALILVSALLIPALSLLIAFAAMIIGIWLLVHFLNAAMRFNSMGQAIGLLIAVSAALLIGMMFLITLAGGPSTFGMP